MRRSNVESRSADGGMRYSLASIIVSVSNATTGYLTPSPDANTSLASP